LSIARSTERSPDLMETDEAIGPNRPLPQAGSVSRWALVTFVVLFVMNLLDYTDRWVLSAVLPTVKSEFGLSYFQSSLLFTLFLLSYTLISPLMGWAGDRMRRTWLLGAGV